MAPLFPTGSCPCIDTASILASSGLANCVVGAPPGAATTINTTQEFDGIYVDGYHNAKGHHCYPITYGSGSCGQHDLLSHPACADTAGNSSKKEPFCKESWCYVDLEKCRDSSELLFRSLTSIDDQLEHDFYYSYSACDSTNHWELFLSTYELKERVLTVTIPTLSHPQHFKIKTVDDIFNQTASIDEIMGNDGDDQSAEALYYKNDTIPWKGYIIKYLNAVLEISNMKGFEFTHRSGGSQEAINSSVHTGAVYDVQSGLSDISASSFWITSERLEMTPFTSPLAIDKIVLWVRDPSSEKAQTSLYENAIQVFRPFSPMLWLFLFVALVIFSILSVWFANKDGERSRWWRKLRDKKWNNGSIYYKTTTVLSVFLDSLAVNTNDSFGAAVGFDIDSSPAQKLLNLGLGFLLLVAVAAYTANLASFLTLSSVGNYISSVEEAIATGVPLCGHAALQRDLTTTWPNANWVFSTVEEKERAVDNAVEVLLKKFDLGLCQGIVAGLSDILDDSEVANKFCDRELVYTRSIVMQKSIAFPARKDIVAGFSHWMYEAKQRGINLEDFQKEARTAPRCALSLGGHEDGIVEEEDLTPLTPKNLALPLFTLALCCLISALIHFVSRAKKRTSTGATLSDDGECDNSNVTLGMDKDSNNFSSLAAFNGKRLSIEDMSDSRTLYKTLLNLQSYQNDLVKSMIEREKEEKEEIWGDEEIQ